MIESGSGDFLKCDDVIQLSHDTMWNFKLFLEMYYKTIDYLVKIS